MTPSRKRKGFTLIELCVVIALIGIIMAIALPRFMPAIAFSSFEGAAMHLANYGRAAMAQAVLSREALTVKFDLDKQDYRTLRLIVEDPNATDPETGKESGKLFEPFGGADSATDNPEENEAYRKAEAMQLAFKNSARMALQARAKNVEHEGILSDIGPLFEKEFKLDDNEDEQYEEVSSPLLVWTPLPDDVRIESVHMGGKDYVKGEVSIDIGPLGLTEPVVFYLVNDEGDYYSVGWDAITGEASVMEGKQQVDVQ